MVLLCGRPAGSFVLKRDGKTDGSIVDSYSDKPASSFVLKPPGSFVYLYNDKPAGSFILSNNRNSWFLCSRSCCAKTGSLFTTNIFSNKLPWMYERVLQACFHVHMSVQIFVYICILLLVKHRLTTHKAHNKIKMLLNDCPSNVLSHTRGYSQAESFICQAIIVTAIRRRNQSLCRKVRTIHGQEAIGTLFSWPGHLKTVHQFSTPQSHRTLYK